ncbi:serine/threonine-protein kinase [Streptomyces sp. KR80]|uniref:serine/threonine-protein kinase n=1 Tax=Streptomyces sp. KR80 TaxID=3457426 RepID=UPI003FD1D3B1
MSGTAGEIIDGRFELLERLGSGGMGTVWRARDLALQREVALKEVRPLDPAMAAADPEAARVLHERVLREARALARLSHPNVVTVHHIVDEDPLPWIVMELLPGPSLDERLESGPLPPAEAARIGRGILAALRAAHAVGIHHRDVKPANVLLRADGTAVLTDFGIAALHGSTTLTQTGNLLGSPEYMAPERIRGTDDDPASDLWSLGMLLYVSVEGVSPLRRASTLATLAAVLDDPVPPPLKSGLLTPVLTTLLVRDPAARPTAERLDAMLADAAAGRIPAPLIPPPPPIPTQLDAGQPAAPAQPHTLPTQATTVPSSARTGSRAALIAAVAVLATALVALGVYAAGKPSDGNLEARGPKSPVPSRTTSPATSPTASPSTVATRSTKSPKPTERPSPPPTTPQAPTPTPSAPAPPPVPPAGTWMAQLYSVPVSGTDQAERNKLLANVRRQVPKAQIMRSDRFASLKPGYWVIYATGPFANGHEALDFCAKRGRDTANQCVGRYLSHSVDDRYYICRPAEDGKARTGNCYHS